MNTTRRLVQTCDICDSQNVTKDAPARWDVDAQEWKVSDTVYGSFEFCCDCGHETTISAKVDTP